MKLFPFFVCGLYLCESSFGLLCICICKGFTFYCAWKCSKRERKKIELKKIGGHNLIEIRSHWTTTKKNVFNGKMSENLMEACPIFRKNLWNTVHYSKIICANRHDFLFHRWTFFFLCSFVWSIRIGVFYPKKNIKIFCLLRWKYLNRSGMCFVRLNWKCEKKRKNEKWTMKFEVDFFRWK